MELIPIQKTLKQNSAFINNAGCLTTLNKTIEYFLKIGYDPPWIGYYALKNDVYVGTGAFKGKPKNAKVEIAYVTFEKYRNQGIGSEICNLLVKIAQQKDDKIIISARTLRELSYSTKILKKNNFMLKNEIIDTDGAEAWEWFYNTGTV